VRTSPFLAQFVNELRMPLRALAVDGAHELQFFFRARGGILGDTFAHERCLFPPADILFEKFENDIS